MTAPSALTPPPCTISSYPEKCAEYPRIRPNILTGSPKLADGRFAHVINTEKLFGLEEKELTEASRLLVVKPELPGQLDLAARKDPQASGPYIGPLVERMGTVLEIADNEIMQHLPISRIDKNLLAGVVTSGQQVIVLFNMPAILDRLEDAD